VTAGSLVGQREGFARLECSGTLSSSSVPTFLLPRSASSPGELLRLLDVENRLLYVVPRRMRAL
jgi:hypothetical protein